MGQICRCIQALNNYRRGFLPKNCLTCEILTKNLIEPGGSNIQALEKNTTMAGYACIPYSHDHDSIALKDTWENSRNVEDMFFVTATFSEESKPYFSTTANQYLLVKFKNNQKMERDIEKYPQQKASFVFKINEDLFQRNLENDVNFVSVYYLEYSESDEDVSEVANVVAKRDQVGTAGVGSMGLYCLEPPKFTFPYADHIVVLEVASEKGHQSVNKYCERTRRDVCRKGITMTNLVSLSVLEKLK